VSRSVIATRAGAALVAAAVVVGLAGPTSGARAVTLDDLDRAEQRVEGLEGELDTTLAAYEDTISLVDQAVDELERLRREERRLEVEARRAERLISRRARAVFIQGSTASFEALLASGDATDAVERAALVATLQLREGTRLEQARAAHDQLDQVRLLVEDRQTELEALEQRLDALAAELLSRLEAAQSEAQRIRTIVARQRRIDRGAQQGIYACIFDGGYRFRDSWGAPRSGGRRHRGTDVMAPFNQPVYAFTSGVIQRTSWSGLGGLGLYLRGDDGHRYYYAHLNSVESGMTPGRWVAAGQLIARNGSTGNAPRSAPHVHFEVQPGGSAAVNPYPWLAAACH
jgi:peptidoglycan LD-endopeptidase LytH